ncbi:MAG TPA: MFS transporter, partial [Bryobacteraceae bacterium]|nr:MFS transporter [Bryobacteraceae bacterium]
LAGVALLSRVQEDFEPGPPSERRGFFPTHLIVPGLAVGFVNVHFPVIAGFLVLHLAHAGNSGPKAFSAYAIVILFSRFFLGGLPDRIAPAITFYFGISSMAVGLLLLSTTPGPVVAVAAAGLLGLGFSFPWSSIVSTVLRRLPQNERGSAVGFLSMFYDLFVGGSSFTAGLVADRFGYTATFIMASVALIGAAAMGRMVFFAKAEKEVQETAVA